MDRILQVASAILNGTGVVESKEHFQSQTPNFLQVQTNIQKLSKDPRASLKTLRPPGFCNHIQSAPALPCATWDWMVRACELDRDLVPTCPSLGAIHPDSNLGKGAPAAILGDVCTQCKDTYEKITKAPCASQILPCLRAKAQPESSCALAAWNAPCQVGVRSQMGRLRGTWGAWGGLPSASQLRRIMACHQATKSNGTSLQLFGPAAPSLTKESAKPRCAQAHDRFSKS